MLTETKNPSSSASCKDVVQDIHDIIAQINRYLHMKNLGSSIDVFFYIERSVRAKQLCQQLTPADGVGNPHFDELELLYRSVKDRWQHDFQVIAYPPSMHKYLKDDGRITLAERKNIL